MTSDLEEKMDKRGPVLNLGHLNFSGDTNKFQEESYQSQDTWTQKN